METKYDNNAKVFKALCDPNRLMILEMLQSGDKCACKILEDLNIVQSTLSHHMKILCESGIVSSHRVGKWTHYSLSKEGCETAKSLLIEITTVNGNRESKESCISPVENGNVANEVPCCKKDSKSDAGCCGESNN